MHMHTQNTHTSLQNLERGPSSQTWSRGVAASTKCEACVRSHSKTDVQFLFPALALSLRIDLSFALVCPSTIVTSNAVFQYIRQ